MIQDIINTWMDGVQTNLVANYERLGLRASGRWANSLEQFSEQKGGAIRFGIKGESYTEQLQRGRRPNQKQDKESIRKWVGWAGSTFIKKWVEDKGLNISPYAVAHKIASEGWKVPNKHNAGGLVTDVVTDARILELNKLIGLFYVESFKQAFK
jgi:hypothetical protein